MIRQLIRMKCFERWRLLGQYYLIAIDGSGVLTFKERHCPGCLETTLASGKSIYYHHILEAKLIMANGLALSIESVFIENIDPKTGQPASTMEKQDCELKAFYRLAEKLKKDFPQLNICLLLDGLYAAKPVFDVAQRNKWKYVITFKEGSMPETFQEYESLKKLVPENRAHLRFDAVTQDYKWVTEIPYQGHSLNVLECLESQTDQEDKRWVWLTNLMINQNNYDQIANQGGRLRWKIENEGFNMQKNGGYNLEHAFSIHPEAMKNFYLLLQIAHLLNQLIEKGSLLKNVKKVFGSLRNVSRRLLEAMRTSTLSLAEQQYLCSVKYQIRFDSS